MTKQLIDQLISLFQKQKFGFISIKNYTSKDGEISSRTINIGFKYDNLKQNDIEVLQNGVKFINGPYTPDVWKQATQELLQSLIKPLENRSKAQTDSYIQISENGALKFNVNTNKLYIIGIELKDTKKVIEEGEYKEVNSKPITIAKNVIKANYLKSGMIRNFVVESIGEIRINGECLEIG